MAHCGRMVRDKPIAQWSQWRVYRKPPSFFRIVPSLTLTISPSQKGGPKYILTNFATATWRI